MADARNGNGLSERVRVDEQLLDAIAGQFEEQWRQAVRGALLPDLDMHLERVDAPYRDRLREALATIDQRYRPRVAAAGQRVDTGEAEPPTASRGNGFAETIVHTQTRKARAASAATAAAPTLPFEPGGESGQTSGSEDATLAPVAQTSEEPTLPPKSEQETVAPMETDTSLSVGVPAALFGAEVGCFGDYELLQEIARGGMGVVFKARQISLDRIVALKMILAGQLASESEVQRFHTEAEAAAKLDHPGIVPIHEVGEHEGQHFFSMGFVDGQSLAEKLAAGPLPPEEVAELTRKLAEAIAYAHEQGVIHRDLKPANVLVDNSGQPRITDFGVAKKLKGDSHLTGTGQILGTPSYMPPEQAAGETHEIGPAADVYALGAVLYTMLTGRPPFQAPSPMETLLQVLEKEPVAPRQLDPGIPRDLETICLKCLQKDPMKRYASAGELDDDLRRFCEGFPINARPVGPIERAWLWCKRNPRIAIPRAAAAVLAVALMIGGPIAAGVIYQQKKRADENAQAATEAKKEAEANEVLADRNREVASEQRELAVDAVRSLVYAAQKELENRPALQSVKDSLLKIALESLTKVADKNQDYRGADMMIASTIRRQGDLFLDLGEGGKAIEQYRHSLKILQQMQAEQRLTRTHLNFGVLYDKLGEAARRFGKPREAKEYFLKVLKHYQSWAAEDPDNSRVQKLLAQTYGRLGQVAVILGNPSEARHYYTKTLQLRKEWIAAQPDSADAQRELAGALGGISDCCFMEGDFAKAKQHARQSLDILKTLAQAHPEDVVYRWNVALKYGSLGDVTIMDNDPAAAKELYLEAVTRLKQISDEDPRNMRKKRQLGRAHYVLAAACLALNDPVAAEHFRKSLKLRQEAADKDPKSASKQVDLMVTLARCGQHESAAEIAGRLRKGSPNASRLYHVACGYALCSAATTDDDQRQRYRDQGLASLQDAVNAGFADVVLIQRDPDLEPIRDAEECERLIKQLEDSKKD
jgi:tetratricopeptide (TPR) repeat protein/predicted Ser/Thr protein kinase